MRPCRSCVVPLAAATFVASIMRCHTTAAQLPTPARLSPAANGAADTQGFDPLWLRYAAVPGGQLASYKQILGNSAVVVCTPGAACEDGISQSQLSAAAAELSTGLGGLLGSTFTATVVAASRPLPAGTKLVASVLGGASLQAFGKEGFRI